MSEELYLVALTGPEDGPDWQAAQRVIEHKVSPAMVENFDIDYWEDTPCLEMVGGADPDLLKLDMVKEQLGEDLKVFRELVELADQHSGLYMTQVQAGGEMVYLAGGTMSTVNGLMYGPDTRTRWNLINRLLGTDAIEAAGFTFTKR